MFVRIGNILLNLNAINRVDISDDGLSVRVFIHGEALGLTGENAQQLLSHIEASEPAHAKVKHKK